MMPHDSCNIVKQCTLRWVVETLSLSYCAKGLARKTCQKNIKLWDFSFVNLSDIAMWDFTKVCFVGFSGVFVPLGRKHALTFCLFKGESHAPNPGKEIYETEIFRSIHFHYCSINPLDMAGLYHS
jgi:hypothetical protein